MKSKRVHIIFMEYKPCRVYNTIRDTVGIISSKYIISQLKTTIFLLQTSTRNHERLKTITFELLSCLIKTNLVQDATITETMSS